MKDFKLFNDHSTTLLKKACCLSQEQESGKFSLLDKIKRAKIRWKQSLSTKKQNLKENKNKKNIQHSNQERKRKIAKNQ